MTFAILAPETHAVFRIMLYQDSPQCSPSQKRWKSCGSTIARLIRDRIVQVGASQASELRVHPPYSQHIDLKLSVHDMAFSNLTRSRSTMTERLFKDRWETLYCSVDRRGPNLLTVRWTIRHDIDMPRTTYQSAINAGAQSR